MAPALYPIPSGTETTAYHGRDTHTISYALHISQRHRSSTIMHRVASGHLLKFLSTQNTNVLASWRPSVLHINVDQNVQGIVLLTVQSTGVLVKQ